MNGEERQPLTGIVAFLFTDLEDSTVRWEQEPAAMAVDLARHRGLVDAVVARFAGVTAPEQGGGDSTVTAFTRASDALTAALELQTAMHGSTWEGGSPLRARVAVHVGEVQVDDRGAYSGPTMNRCGRLLQAAHGGQILASSTAFELARNGLDSAADVADLGPHHLRGIEEPLSIVQVSSPELPSTFPPLRTAAAAGSTLPHPDSSFVGRVDDLSALADLIEGHRLVSIVGAGGCGKTRLAVELAHDVLGRFRHGAVWVDLAPASSPDGVLDAVAVAAGLHTSSAVTPGRVAAHLADRSTLLLLDNCEHVIDAAATIAARIECECPLVRIVATSREPLALKDEVVWRVPSLSGPVEADGSDLLDSDAGRLMVERIGRLRPGYEPAGDDAVALAAVCRRLDGIPLAIELAAARTAAIPPVELASRLDDRFSLLAGGARDVIARQRTLEASVAWSYQLLDRAEQQAFRRLSAFAGSFPLSAAAELCGPGSEDTVLRLLRCSLLVERPGTGPRMAMLEPVRWFARERLVDGGEADEVLGRHLDWCVGVARALGSRLEGPGVRTALRSLDDDVDNLRAGMEWALAHDRSVDAARILGATPWFWIWRGRVSEARRWIHRVESAPPPLPPEERLGLVWALFEVMVNSAGDVGPIVEEGLALAQALDDPAAEARLRVSLSRYLAFTDPDAVIEDGPRHRSACRQVGDRFWAATSLVSEALAEITLGRFDLALPLLDQLRDEARELGHPQLVADEIARRSLVDRRFGRYDAVQRAVGEVDELTEGFTSLNSRALVHTQAALIDVAQGRAADALQRMEELYHRYAVAKDNGYLPSIALPMIDALIDLDRAEEAIERFEPLWDAFRVAISWRLRLGVARASALVAAGDAAGARPAFEAVVDEARAVGNAHESAIAETFLAAIDRRQQHYAEADAKLHRALEVQAELGYPQYVADVLEGLAGLELDHARPTPAATLFGAASSIRDGASVVRRVGTQATYDADLGALRDRLGEDELRRSWTAGAQLTMAEAVELARRGRGRRGRPTGGWESLTPTETSVAELVAQGCTNPEIAERLIMGRSTVKTHVSAVLRKLGLVNRTQIAGAVNRRD